jgi:hypothetical protein
MKKSISFAKAIAAAKHPKRRSQEWRDFQCLPEPETPIEKFRALLAEERELAARQKAAKVVSRVRRKKATVSTARIASSK